MTNVKPSPIETGSGARPTLVTENEKHVLKEA